MAKPKLALIPAAQGSKLFSVLPSSGVGDFDFTRSGSATRINSQGLIETVANTSSRLNYPMIDGKVVGCPHHLLEPQRTNLIPYSEDFAQPAWSKINATIELNSTISPDGTLNASKIIDDATNGYHRITDAFTTPSSGNFTYSIFLKKGTLTTAQFQVFDGTTAASALVDLENGTIKSDGQGINHKIENYGNGWYRCSVSGVYGGSTTTVYVYTKQKTPNYIGSGDYLYIWGAQFEEASYLTSYIPTNGSAVTRSAESANGSGDAATFNDSEGVLMAEMSALADDGTTRQIDLSYLGTNTDYVRLEFAATSNLIYGVVKNTSQQAALSYTVPNSTDSNKIAIKYKANDFALWVNGFEVDTDTNGTTPSNLNDLSMQSTLSANPFRGNTKQIQYYNSALTDSELEKISSWTSFTDMANGQLYTIE